MPQRRDAGSAGGGGGWGAHLAPGRRDPPGPIRARGPRRRHARADGGAARRRLRQGSGADPSDAGSV
eukprot:3036537-Pyramimonas_sp.AAC.1